MSRSSRRLAGNWWTARAFARAIGCSTSGPAAGTCCTRHWTGSARAHRASLTARGRLAFSTYARYDERVDAARAVLRRWADLPAPPSTVDDLDDRENIRRVVEGAGFGNVSIADVPVVTTFDSAAQWWDWAWSVGFRAALEKIPPDRRAGARAEAERALGIDGGAGLSITTVIRYTTADVGR